MEPAYLFNDPVHGQIRVTSLERRVIDRIEFQRLRFIRQLALLHYVFPGATNTRFAHSIGASHNAGLVAKVLFPETSNHSQCYPIQVFRLAALLHDVGHGAFSHSLSHLKLSDGSDFLPSLGEVLKNSGQWELSAQNNDPITEGIKKQYSGEMGKPIEHEALSALIIKRIFSELRTIAGEDLLGVAANVWAQDISSLILTEIEPSTDFRDKAHHLLKQNSSHLARGHKTIPKGDDLTPTHGILLVRALSLLISGTVDVDRMDYLLRDSLNCGVTYGIFAKEILINNMALFLTEKDLVLAFKKKAVNAIDDFLWSRYQLFKQVLGHKTNSAYNLLLEKAMSELVAQKNLEAPKSLGEYLQLTDDFIMSKIINLTQKGGNSSNWISRFSVRNMPKYLGSVEEPLSESEKSTPREKYDAKKLPRYDGIDGDPHFAFTPSKAEVIKDASAGRPYLPKIIAYSKSEQIWQDEDYAELSVFFDNFRDKKTEDIFTELTRRFNRKKFDYFRLI